MNKFCTFCGYRLNDFQNFCPCCGNKVKSSNEQANSNSFGYIQNDNQNNFNQQMNDGNYQNNYQNDYSQNNYLNDNYQQMNDGNYQNNYQNDYSQNNYLNDNYQQMNNDNNFDDDDNFFDNQINDYDPHRPQERGQIRYSSMENRPYNALAIIGFICSFIFGTVGLILSIISLVQIKQHAQQGKGLAIAGVVIGGLFTLYFIITLIFPYLFKAFAIPYFFII